MHCLRSASVILYYLRYLRSTSFVLPASVRVLFVIWAPRGARSRYPHFSLKPPFIEGAAIRVDLYPSSKSRQKKFDILCYFPRF